MHSDKRSLIETRTWYNLRRTLMLIGLKEYVAVRGPELYKYYLQIGFGVLHIRLSARFRDPDMFIEGRHVPDGPGWIEIEGVWYSMIEGMELLQAIYEAWTPVLA